MLAAALHAGAVLPAVLRQLGLVSCSADLAAALDQQQQLPEGADERALRAAAVAAVDEVVRAAATTSSAGVSSNSHCSVFSADDLSTYLLSAVQGSGNRLLFHEAALAPHITRVTIAY